MPTPDLMGSPLRAYEPNQYMQWANSRLNQQGGMGVPRRAQTSMVQPQAQIAAPQQPQPPINGAPINYNNGGYNGPGAYGFGQTQQGSGYNSPWNDGQPAWMSGQWSGNGIPPARQTPGGITNPSPARPAAPSTGGGGAAPAQSAPASRSVYNDGFWDYDSSGYKLDSVGNRVMGEMGTGPTQEQMTDQFNTLKTGGLVFWPGSYSTWWAAGKPLASSLSEAEKNILANGGDWNKVQIYRMTNPGAGTTPTTPTPTNPPASPPATGGGALPPANGGYQYPFMNQPMEWYGNPANQNAVGGYWNAYLPAMEFAQNQANNLNNWNMDVWKSGWGMTGDQFNMGMDQSQMMNDYNNNLNILNSNDWNNQLQADTNAYGYGSQLYGNLYGADQQLQGDYLNAQANQYGSYLGAGANLANTYANTGLGYDTLTNQYSIAQMQALNDWYNNQARNQTDLQMATMQAFGRDQAPNTRFLSNWG